MGYSILELVLRRLREKNFTADVAYPGQMFPKLTGPVAAVHIQKVDRAGLTVTIQVNIVCPAAMGGTACEMEALRATEVLRWTGAVCVQNGCSYDGVGQVYVVEILASYTGVTEADSCEIGPGFSVYINDAAQPYVQSVEERENPGLRAEHTMGEPVSTGYSQGKKGWVVVLEELIPAGSKELPGPIGTFELVIESAHLEEIYGGCRWTEIQRTYTQQGLRRIRTCLAQTREEEHLG